MRELEQQQPPVLADASPATPPQVESPAGQPEQTAVRKPSSGQEAIPGHVVDRFGGDTATGTHAVATDAVVAKAITPPVPPAEDCRLHEAERRRSELNARQAEKFGQTVAASEEPPQTAAASTVQSEHVEQQVQPIATVAPQRWRRLYQLPLGAAARCWDFVSLLVLLAVIAAVPIVQLASLGYLLTAASRLAQGERWARSLPGLRLAGKLGTFVLLAFLFWLPVWLVADLSYSAQLLQPGSGSSRAWRIGAFTITTVWMLYVSWAAIRGGRWWHFIWPAPIKFFRRIWRYDTWAAASDRLYELAVAFQFPRLWWLGARAAVGAIAWTCIPVSLMIIGLRSDGFSLAVPTGLLGALLMIVVMLYLPFLQIQMASENRLSSMLDLRKVRRRFKFAPLAHGLSLLGLCLLCIPLYLLRIEATPQELLWAPSLVFVAFMLPAKLLLGAAMGYGDRRAVSDSAKPRHWSLRHTARLVGVASVLLYVGALYVAQLVASQGAYVMYFQHAFLVPAPLISV